MNREQKARDLMAAIRYQVFTPEVSTMGACPRCGESSRGAGRCEHCLTLDLERVVGPKEANEYLCCCIAQRKAEHAVLLRAEALQGGGDG